MSCTRAGRREIHATIERVYAIAADVPNSPDWQPSLTSVETVETDASGRATVVNTEADAKVKTTKQRLRFAYDEPTGMSWEQEKGDVKSLRGSWTFVELEAGRTEATYELRVDPGRVLGMLVRGPVEGKVKEHLTKGAAEGLKQAAEADLRRPPWRGGSTRTGSWSAGPTSHRTAGRTSTPSPAGCRTPPSPTASTRGWATRASG